MSITMWCVLLNTQQNPLPFLYAAKSEHHTQYLKLRQVCWLVDERTILNQFNYAVSNICKLIDFLEQLKVTQMINKRTLSSSLEPQELTSGLSYIYPS